MLAVYDFEDGALQNAVRDKEFNQSKLYDKLFQRFTERQVKKDENFGNLSPEAQDREKELFRLRLGLMSLMMFLNDTTLIDAERLTDELETFGLSGPGLRPQKILSGFFFIYQSKASQEIEKDIYKFEFLHKTFGEFLAVDFLLRVVLSQGFRPYKNKYRILSNINTFNFCFGYNWLHKHYKITSFLFEYAEQFLKQICKDRLEHFIEFIAITG